jgi:hypothetical protein
MRVGIRLGPLYFSSGHRRRYRRRHGPADGFWGNRSTTWWALFGLWAGTYYICGWVIWAIFKAVVWAVTAIQVHHASRQVAPAESDPVLGGGSAGREQQVR